MSKTAKNDFLEFFPNVEKILNQKEIPPEITLLINKTLFLCQVRTPKNKGLTILGASINLKHIPFLEEAASEEMVLQRCRG
jgi:hypothetical protein